MVDTNGKVTHITNYLVMILFYK